MQLIRIDETARRLRISRRGLHRLVNENREFPRPIRVGPGRVVFDVDAVDAWLRKQAETEACHS